MCYLYRVIQILFYGHYCVPTSPIMGLDIWHYTWLLDMTIMPHMQNDSYLCAKFNISTYGQYCVTSSLVIRLAMVTLQMVSTHNFIATSTILQLLVWYILTVPISICGNNGVGNLHTMNGLYAWHQCHTYKIVNDHFWPQ